MDTNATAAQAVPCPADRPRIYVACLAAYNGGRLHGQWIDATEPDEVREEVRTMLATSPEPDAEEWAIHDHEGFEGCTISEWASFDTVCALADFVEQHGRLGARLYGHFEDERRTLLPRLASRLLCIPGRKQNPVGNFNCHRNLRRLQRMVRDNGADNVAA